MAGAVSDRLHVAVVGAGSMARHHVAAFAAIDDCRVVAVANRGAGRAQELAAEFDVREVYSDYRKMVDQTRPDAVVIAVSIPGVEAVATDCLDCGIPALIEKPAGMSSSATGRLAQLAAERGVLGMVGVNRRYYSVLRRARAELPPGDGLIAVGIEAPERVAAVRASGLHGDDVMDRWIFANGVHGIDLLRFFGGEVGQISVVRNRWKHSSSDSFVASLRFESGSLGHYVSHWPAPGGWSVTLYGEGRRIEMSPLEKGTIIEEGGGRHKLVPDDCDVRFKPGVYLQAVEFLAAVRSGDSPSFPASTLEDARRTMELVETIAGTRSTIEMSS